MNRWLRWLLAGVAALAGVGIVAPFIRIDQYTEQIRDGLQRTFHRKVDIRGATRLNLFQGPGVTIGDVVIHDDPTIGREPLARVPELQIAVSLRSLWT